MRASDIGIVAGGRDRGDQRCRARSRSTGSTAPASRGSPRAPPGVYRETSRSAPYNLFARLGRHRRAPQGRGRAAGLPAVGRPRPTCPRAARRAPSPPTSAATPPLAVPGRRATSTPTPTPPRATSSRPTRCWCCGSRSATPATATPPATRCPRRSSRARARRCCSTAVASSRAPGPRTV